MRCRLASRALLVTLAACALVATPGRALADGSGDSGPIPTTDLRPLHALSFYGRGLFIPDFLLSIGLQASQPLTSGALGLSYTFRKGTLDIVTTLDYSFLGPPDGNFLGNGKDAAIDTHYTQFRDLNMLSLDVSFYWVKDISRYVAFTIGGGVGLGLMLGDVLVVNNSGAGCTSATASDVTKCHPNVTPSFYTRVGNPVPTWTDANGKTQDLSGPLVPSDPDFSRKLDGLAASQQKCKDANAAISDCRDTADHPYAHPAPEKPPVMVVINFQIGLKLKLHRHFNFNIHGGFRDGFFVGGGPEVVF